jgi:predicted N-acyltransferase
LACIPVVGDRAYHSTDVREVRRGGRLRFPAHDNGRNASAAFRWFNIGLVHDTLDDQVRRRRKAVSRLRRSARGRGLSVDNAEPKEYVENFGNIIYSVLLGVAANLSADALKAAVRRACLAIKVRRRMRDTVIQLDDEKEIRLRETSNRPIGRRDQETWGSE